MLRPLTILTILISLAGCIRSLHPIYTERDIFFDPNLIGQWSDDAGKEIWTFSARDSNNYNLVHTDNRGKQGRFIAHLVKINETLFLDLFPGELEVDGNDFYQFHFLPVHTFLYVQQIQPTLQMSFPDGDWLKAILEENPQAIGHETTGDEVVLTAGTKELQTFWLNHITTAGAFGDPTNLKQQPATPN